MFVCSSQVFSINLCNSSVSYVGTQCGDETFEFVNEYITYAMACE